MMDETSNTRPGGTPRHLAMLVDAKVDDPLDAAAVAMACLSIVPQLMLELIELGAPPDRLRRRMDAVATVVDARRAPAVDPMNERDVTRRAAAYIRCITDATLLRHAGPPQHSPGSPPPRTSWDDPDCDG